MDADSALRFAKASRFLYRYARTFSIPVGSEEELDPIAEAFESIGCKVTRKDAVRLVMIVSCGDVRQLGSPSPSVPDDGHRREVGREQRIMPGIVPNLGDTLVLAAHVRAIAREAAERARETRAVSREAVNRFVKAQELRKQEADLRGP